MKAHGQRLTPSSPSAIVATLLLSVVAASCGLSDTGAQGPILTTPAAAPSPGDVPEEAGPAQTGPQPATPPEPANEPPNDPGPGANDPGKGVNPSSPQSPPWASFVGTTAADQGLFVALGPDGRVALAGRTEGKLGSGEAHGRSDGFVQAWLSDGTSSYVTQFGGEGIDLALGAAFTAQGDLWVTGQTNADFEGLAVNQPVAGFLSRLDGSGRLVLSRVLDGAALNAVALVPPSLGYPGGPVVVGTAPARFDSSNYDSLIELRDEQGNFRWRLPWSGPGYDAATTVVTAPNGDLIVGGFAEGSVGDGNKGETDGYVARIDPRTSRIVWVRDMGSPEPDAVTRVALSGSDILVTGYAGAGFEGRPGVGGNDAFVAWLSFETGKIRRVIVLGSPGSEGGYGVAPDGSGGALVVGRIDDGSFTGQTALGGGDAFIAHVRVTSNGPTVRQFGGRGMDEFQAIARDDRGVLFIAGYTSEGRFPFGSLPRSSGNVDAFLGATTLDALFGSRPSAHPTPFEAVF